MGLTDSDKAWTSQGRPAVVIRCRECRRKFGWMTDSDEGPLVVAHSEYGKRNAAELERLKHLKRQLGYRGTQSVETRLLNDWGVLRVRCSCARGRFEVDESTLRTAWEGRKGSVSV